MYREEDNILYMFGCLAYGVGFDSREIQESIERPADREILRSVLLKAREPKHYPHSTAEFNTYVEKITKFFNAALASSGSVTGTTEATEKSVC
jgi:hypothetical protein